MTAPTLDRAAFRAWLAAKPERARAGSVASVCDCPIAEYLHEQGWTGLAVNGKKITVWCGRGRSYCDYTLPTPDWASAFIRGVDACRGYSVTAGRCLRLLDAIPEEVPS